MLTLFINRSVTYETWSKEHWQEKKLRESHLKSAQQAREKVEELLKEDSTLQPLSQKEVGAMLNDLVDKATTVEESKSDKLKLIFGLLAISAVSFYLLKRLGSRKYLK